MQEALTSTEDSLRAQSRPRISKVTDNENNVDYQIIEYQRLQRKMRYVCALSHENIDPGVSIYDGISILNFLAREWARDGPQKLSSTSGGKALLMLFRLAAAERSSSARSCKRAGYKRNGLYLFDLKESLNVRHRTKGTTSNTFWIWNGS